MKYVQAKSSNFNVIEISVVAMIWLGIFSIPFFQNRMFNTIDWSKVVGEWIRMFSFLVIFILNAYIFVPKILFRKKYVSYITATLAAVLIIIGIIITIQIFIMPPQPLSMPRMDLGPGMPPMELGSKMPAPMGFRTPEQPESKSIFMTFTDNLIISILVVAAGTSFKMLSQWLKEEDRRKDMEKEQLKTEIALLRHQVSPHFFMNTLNNIHALVDINTETAKDAIIRLSTLMRYLLYDTAHGQTSLKKEIEFIESYITLMQLRFSEKVKISIDVPKNIPDIQIPPMLFISFLENAFKHGVSYQANSFVNFKIEVAEDHLSCVIKNSKQRVKENFDKSYSGIGLTNIRKSLELLFAKDYTLNIIENDKAFEVFLTIPVYDNKMYSH
ncbi:MAG: histidine kinase [Paludibacter sp.]